MCQFLGRKLSQFLDRILFNFSNNLNNSKIDNFLNLDLEDISKHIIRAKIKKISNK